MSKNIKNILRGQVTEAIGSGVKKLKINELRLFGAD